MVVEEPSPRSPSDDYVQLKDLKLSFDLPELDGEHGFCFCFWLYISQCSHFPAPVLLQVQPNGKIGHPFIALNEDKRITFFPMCCLREESSFGNSHQSRKDVSVSAGIEFPLLKWIHIGCQVTINCAHLYIDGNIAAEMAFSSSDSGSKIENLRRLILVGNEHGEKLLGCFHDLQHLPISISIADQFLKDPPTHLSVDLSCISDGIEECKDGIWSIIGGKASCCSNFNVAVVLLDAFGRTSHLELEIFASLVYADNGELVGKTENGTEAPLLVNIDGLEFPSMDKPVKVIHGRASIKLKISQLSSKCDDRLFRVLFQSTDVKYSFIRAYSPPIHSISRNPKIRSPNSLGRKIASTVQLVDGSHPHRVNDDPNGILGNYDIANLRIPDSDIPKFAHSPKRARIVSHMNIDTHRISQPRSNGCCSHSSMADDGNEDETESEENDEHLGEMDDFASDSESIDTRHFTYETSETVKNLLADSTVFRYCLEGTDERCMLLKEIGLYALEEDIQKFAEQVALYSGCSHHGYQIMMAKQLVQEGISSWNAISKGNAHAPWIDSLPEIIRRFRKISRSSRALTGQDIEVLRRIAGCGDDMNHENFDKLWRWLYPIAVTISIEQINDMWEYTSPKWIEGLITKEEAENALRSPEGHGEPGIFVLRFPTSRSWPHPDAGCLVITFVGADHAIHNKLLSIDARNAGPTALTDSLLEEPELSRLARVRRFM